MFFASTNTSLAQRCNSKTIWFKGKKDLQPHILNYKHAICLTGLYNHEKPKQGGTYKFRERFKFESSLLIVYTPKKNRFQAHVFKGHPHEYSLVCYLGSL